MRRMTQELVVKKKERMGRQKRRGHIHERGESRYGSLRKSENAPVGVVTGERGGGGGGKIRKRRECWLRQNK